MRRENTFEIFGLDYMIDDNFKVWLIEVNTNPCLAISSSILARIIPSMIVKIFLFNNFIHYYYFSKTQENAFRIAIDPILTPPGIEDWPGNKRQYCPDGLVESNKFELIYDEFYEGYNLRNLMQSVDNKLSSIFYLYVFFYISKYLFNYLLLN